MGKAYGQTCPPGGWIAVMCDLEAGIVSYIINGQEFGKAVQHDHLSEGEYFLTVFLGGKAG